MSFDSPAEALRAAVDLIGSQSATGRLLGLSQAAVWGWLKDKRALPPEHVLAVEAETKRLGNRISRHDLRPDIYPREDQLPPRAGSLGDLEPAR